MAKGQVLASLDPADFRLRVEQAQAALDQTRIQLGLAPGGEDDRADPERTPLVREARALLDSAKLNRERLASLGEKGYAARAEVDDAARLVRRKPAAVPAPEATSEE